MPPEVLLTGRELGKSFGSDPVFTGLSFTLATGDHVALIGPNGSGKSTLLKILAGQIEPDDGELVVRKGLRVGYVPQDPVFAPGRSVEEVLREAAEAAAPASPAEHERRIAVALGTAGFDDRDARTDVLSGGWRKRLAIARELAADPDVLLLDEPTNHLDLEAILWLEELLRTASRAFVVVSHDRTFLERTAGRVLEIDRRYPEGLFAVDGSYTIFLEARDARLKSDESYRATLANLVRREVEWLRRGPKARTTKSKARIESAEARIAELADAEARASGSTAGIELVASGRRSKRLWRAEGLTKRFDGRTIVENLDLELTAGSRLGILGPNGAGKTTLLRLLVGELEPDGGTIHRADGLRVVYFEQNRESLDPELTLARALAEEGDHVHFAGKPVHVASWAARFLFRSDQLRTPIGRLSGGERARIAIARLMLRPADLLVLDEPTNDLDIPTLDVLEEALLEFAGALVLVTHDRLLLDRVTTGVLALDGEGGAEPFAGVEQWLAARSQAGRGRKQVEESSDRPTASAPTSRPRKLGYLEQREWDGMEAAVLAAEERLEAADAAVADPAVATDAAALQARLREAAEARAEVERLYARWAELEAKLAGS